MFVSTLKIVNIYLKFKDRTVYIETVIVFKTSYIYSTHILSIIHKILCLFFIPSFQ